MPDILADAFLREGVWLVGLAAFVGGIVRGFTGFGTAMVYLPVAGLFLTPFEALTTLIVKALVGPLIHVPKALRDGDPRDVARLGLGALVAVPFGVWVLTLVTPEGFRWGVSLIALVLLVLLAGGVRFRGRLTGPLVYATGAVGGFLGGFVGLPGPPVIMMYLASTLPARVVRANLILYLILADVLMLAAFGWKGLIVPSAIVLGLLLILPYMAGNWAGALLFRPEAEVGYRRVAYGIIAGSAILGLPIWD